MDSKKGVLLGILVVIMILSVVSVSAGFWDRVFGGDDDELEGELPAAHDVTVSLTNSPPEILAIYQVEDVENSAFNDEVTPFDCDASPDAINEAKIWFKARDANGADDLPGATGFAIDQVGSGEAIPADGNLLLYVTNPGADYAAANKYATVASCQREILCPRSGSCAANEMEYSCTISMNYHDEPGTWTIYLEVADVAGDTADNSGLGAGDGDPVDPNSFDYLENTWYLVEAPAEVQFININPQLTEQVPPADPDLVLDNCGNKDLVSGDIQGSDLTSDDVPGGGDDMPGTSFSISTATGLGGDTTPDECAGENNALDTDGQTADDITTISAKTIDASEAPSLDYDEGGSRDLDRNLYFCIWQQLDTVMTNIDNTYSSTTTKGTTPGTAGHAWEITLYS